MGQQQLASPNGTTTTTGGIFVVLDQLNWLEDKYKVRLCHDGGKLLIWTFESLSIPRDRWMVGYCFEGQKKQLPTKKADRQKFLQPHLELLHGKMEVAKQKYNKVQVIAVGRLACECMTGSSELKKRSCTSWKVKMMWKDIVERSWVTYSTDAALFDPVLIVEITGVVANAAMKVGIPIRVKLNDELPVFDWSNYL